MDISLRISLGLHPDKISMEKPKKMGKIFWSLLYPVNTYGYQDKEIHYPFSVQNFVLHWKPISAFYHLSSNKIMLYQWLEAFLVFGVFVARFLLYHSYMKG